ncbi:MAG: GTPase Era [Candidatus Magasanikbacteria bacterium RIFOXYD2_FULL_41_14]|uniref:GTPase Era n=1 Tax=Candidatus Magasanikbacteria bacterium RIFOXYD2_FULL_41_14 TaxID=1798709 RepID=A0A1F6PCQ2_9BACT|nr:MAG: GTPase Era [Candidatus Magasanikbacteria bacterium RIFOXYD2_FULL_41_14]
MKEKKVEKIQFKSGFVTLIGRSNSGKSTLLNALVGTKLAAVTHKPQTTRHIIHGVLNYPGGQAVFVDTPGVLRDHHNILAGKLGELVNDAIKDIDLAIYVVDPCKAVGAEERFIQSLLRKLDIPKILVINKSDLSAKEKSYIDDYKILGEEYQAVFELSALLNRHVEPLREKVLELLPIGEQLYPLDQITNVNREFLIAEVVREKVLLALRQEVPYTTHVEVQSFEDKGEIVVVKATIFTYDKRYKKMIIGANGRAIKEIGIAARKELEIAMNRKVFLELEVETDRRWEDRI